MAYSRARPAWVQWPNLSTPVRAQDYEKWDQAIYDLEWGSSSAAGSDTSVVARLARIDGHIFDAKDPQFAGGAKIDGSTDDTAAVQAGLAAAKAVPGASLYLSRGTCKISSPLDLTVGSDGVGIIGDGREASSLLMAADNTPIIKTSATNMHSVRIQDLGLVYANQQTPGSHPNSTAIAFMSSVESGNVYWWSLRRLKIDKATTGIGQLTGLTTYFIWNCLFDQILFYRTSKTLIDMTSTRFHVNPINYLRGISHVNASSPAPSGTALKLAGAWTLDGLDVEDWTNQIMDARGGAVGINMSGGLRGVHVERHSITQASPLDIFSFQNGNFEVEGLNYQTSTGSGTAFQHSLLTTTGANLNASRITVPDWGATGTLQLVTGSATDSHVLTAVNDGQDTGVTVGGSASGIVQLEDGMVRARRYRAGITQLTYSASITPDASAGDLFFIDVTNGTAFTINNLTNPGNGQRIMFDIRNSSGGAMGVVSWGAAFKRDATGFVNPANTKRKTINFYYDGTNWVQVGATSADI